MSAPASPARPKPTRRLALGGLVLLGIVAAGSVCSAESPWRRREPAPPPPPYAFSVEDMSGSPLPSFRHAGRKYALGEPGARYNIRVTNPTGERVEAVVTVDGRDAVSGDIGDYVGQRGYLIEPWGSVVIEGFRRSLDEVAAFRFTDRSQSYSALRGTPENVGVIGVAFFPERVKPPAPIARRRPRPEHDDAWRPDARSRSEAAGAGREKSAGRGPGAAPAPAEASRSPQRGGDGAPRKRANDAESRGSDASNIGTEYGESRGSSVIEIPFERRSPTHPASVVTLRYDDYEGLEARGIDLSSLGYAYRYERFEDPEPFPRNRFARSPY